MSIWAKMSIWKSSEYYSIDGAGVQSEPWNWRDNLNECVYECKLGILIVIVFPPIIFRMSNSLAQVIAFSRVFFPQTHGSIKRLSALPNPSSKNLCNSCFLNVSHYAHDIWIH